METGLLNFHDEEHFPVFCEENSDLVNENSIFNSFVEVFNDDVGSSSWILPDDGCEFELGSSVVSDTKEDFTKTFQDWQQHISSLQARDNDIKDPLCDNAIKEDPLCDNLDDMPDIFGCNISIPQNKVPEGEKVQTYKVAKRKGLVLKLTKKKDGCDKSNLSKPKKEDQSNLSKHKKKGGSSHTQNVDLGKLSLPLAQKIKTEPLDDYDIGKNLEIFNKEKSSHSKSETSEIDNKMSSPQIKREPELTDIAEIVIEEPPINLRDIKIENMDSPPYVFEETPYGDITFDNHDITIDNDEIAIDNHSITIDNDEIAVDNHNITIDNDITFVNDRLGDAKNKSAFTNNKADTRHLEDSDSDEETGLPFVPVLPAGDVRTLLEQFETPSTMNEVEKTNDEPVAVTANPEISVKIKLPHHAVQEKVDESFELKQQKQLAPISSLKPCNKSIMEALPKEVIDRIKQSSQRNKKCVAIVPAERLPTHGNDHLKDKGATPVKAVRMLSNQRSSGESVQLDHDYCTNNQQDGTNTSTKKVTVKEELSPADWEKKWDSKKDSGLESGDVSDSSETLERSREKPASSEPVFSQQVQVKTEGIVHIKTEPGEIIEEPKKKKLNLEEYRNRRKNTKPNSPIKHRLGGWVIPATKTNENGTNKQMVNAEVQVKIEDSKTDTSKDNSSDRRGSIQNGRLRRRSSSSSSSTAGRSRYRRRGRSKKRRHSRSQRSHWTSSRSRSRSRSRSKSRSRSRTRSQSRSSLSYSSSSSRSRSRSRGGSRRKHRSRSSYRRNSSYRYSSSKHHSAKRQSKRSDDWSPVEKMRQVEERRVIYVGRLEEGTTKAQLRERFSCFGPIVDISLHFREKGDNYGFVTFAYKVDAYEAVEHGNDYPLQPKYDICFGGRRAFCKQRYSDLDGASPQAYSPYQQNSRSSDSFDKLLREAQKKLLKKSSHV